MSDKVHVPVESPRKAARIPNPPKKILRIVPDNPYSKLPVTAKVTQAKKEAINVYRRMREQRSGRMFPLCEFVREAIDEKLARAGISLDPIGHA